MIFGLACLHVIPKLIRLLPELLLNILRCFGAAVANRKLFPEKAIHMSMCSNRHWM